VIFEQESLAFQILDVLSFNQSYTKTYNSKRNFDALSFRFRADTLIEYDDTQLEFSDNSIGFFPSEKDYTRITQYDEFIVIHFKLFNYHTKEIECLYPEDYEKYHILFKEILDFVYGLKRPYRKNASFIMNDATLASIRKLKDNNGAYIWQPSYQAGEPDRVLGYAVNTSAYAPKNAISFGDYSYYNIGDRGTRSFAELRELFAGNGMVGFVAKERVDGKLVLPEAVQILKLKADATA
jgi:hypothetical protein